MRQIVEVTIYTDYELIEGEWEAVDTKDRKVVEEGLTLEQALERLDYYKEISDDYTTYYIDYEDKSLNLEQWELDWIEQCEIEDREERERLALGRKNQGLPEDLWLDDEDYLDDDFDEEFEHQMSRELRSLLTKINPNYDTFED